MRIRAKRVLLAVAWPVLALFAAGCPQFPPAVDSKDDSLNLAPKVEAITPGRGPAGGGTQVTITGGPFESQVGVRFGAHAAVNPIIVNSRMITAITPPQAPRTVDVTVTTDGGQTTVVGAFTYDGVDIISISPTNGSIGGGTSVTITGENFSPNTLVRFGGEIAGSITVLNSRLITAVTPAHAAGWVSVQVLSDGTEDSLDPTTDPKDPTDRLEGFRYVPPVVQVDSIEPNTGPIEGGTQVTIRGSGFPDGAVVLFGNIPGTQVTRISDGILTVIAPPGAGEGLVDITILHPGGEVLVPDAFTYTVGGPPIDDGTDTDGDGLTDVQEQTGWEVWIENFGLQLGTDTFGNVDRYTVTSDPTLTDTDGDGLDDDLELLIRSDPRLVDSDDDGLHDGEEWNQWLTSPTSVDTDADSRGDRNVQNAPNQALFDGLELFNPAELRLPPGHPDRVVKARATSPTLMDTDGDGASDYDEFDSTVRNGVLADLPLITYELVGDVDVRLDVDYEESIGQTKEYGVTLAESRTETVGSEFSNTLGWSFELGVEVGYAAAALTATVTATAGIHGEYTWTNSTESSRESSKETSRLQSDSRELTESASEGAIRTAILLKNAGNTTFSLNGLSVLVSQREKKKALGDPSPEPLRKTITTLTTNFDTFTLAPGETAGPFELESTGINAERIKELLSAPDMLMLDTASMNFTDSSGLDFDFVRQFTVAQTAYIVLDFGDGEVRQYNVATNVDRNPDSTYRGITLRRALEEVLGLPYGDPINGYTTMVNPGPANDLQVLDSLLGRRYAQRDTDNDGLPDGRDVWTIVTSNPAHMTSDLNSTVLRAGDYLHLMFQRDNDNDGLSDSLEKAVGTDVDPEFPDDADGDGLTDKFEVLTGWMAFAAPGDSGMQWVSTVIDFSSQFSAGDYSAAQVVGAPNTMAYGDFGTAWAASSEDGTLEYITVGFPTPVYASGATIRETYGNGMVYQVDVMDMSNNLHTVWRGTDPSQPGTPVDYKVTWPVTPYLVKGIKVYTDTDGVLNASEQIDAIALHGFPDPRARRVFSDPRFRDVDEDGLTDAQEFAVRSDPSDPDTDGDSLLDGVDPFPIHTAATLHVKAGAPGGNGRSWATAVPTIQAAIMLAAAGQATPGDPADDVSQIWVASGTYKPASRLSPIPLLNNVGIYGGFSGPDQGAGFAGETKRGQRNPNPWSNGCVLSGDQANPPNDSGSIDLQTPGTYADNCPTIVLAPAGVTSATLLNGFMITGAYATTSDTTRGALYTTNSSPTIENCLFLANGNQVGGGGVQAVSASSPVFRKCVFANNIANWGGGVYVFSSGQIVFEDCEFSQNEARRLGNQAHTVSNGGGVATLLGLGGRLDFNRCTFSANRAWNRGGGLHAGFGWHPSQYVRVDRCRFTGNSVTNDQDHGDWNATGGAIHMNTDGSISNSVFWDNRSRHICGGISVINRNGQGNFGQRVAITNCTLSANRGVANSAGAGILVVGQGGGVTIENTIVWGNWYGLDPLPADPTYQEFEQIWEDWGATVNVRNSCVNTGHAWRYRGVNNNINDDPKFNDLALGDLRLGGESPCVDRGNTFVDLDPLLAGLQQLPQFDLFGNPRIVDGNGDGIVSVDIGAFEAPKP